MTPAANSAGSRVLRAIVLLCGLASAFGIDVLGELYWAELLLPLVAVGVLLVDPPRDLLGSRLFLLLMAAIALMFLGYVLSDMVAGTPREMYLRGWGRVAALGSSTFSLCVLCARDRRNLWWFCVGMALGGIAANWMAGMPLQRWKLGYGENFAYLAAASAAVLPLWLASLVLVVLGGLTVLLDYRSLGVQLMLVAVATFLRSRKVGLSQLWRNIPLMVVGFGVVAVAAITLLNASQEGDNVLRREVSNVGRFAALRIGAQAIADSPIVGYGSWGQGTAKYASMLYDETMESLLGTGAEDVVGEGTRGSSFSAHSQIIQSWMEGGILAAAFFLMYFVLLVRAMYQQVFTRPADRLTPLLLLITGTSLWAAVMSPFLGSQRIIIALTVAVIVVLAREKQAAGLREENPEDLPLVPRRPVNLMQ